MNILCKISNPAGSLDVLLTNPRGSLMLRFHDKSLKYSTAGAVEISRNDAIMLRDRLNQFIEEGK